MQTWRVKGAVLTLLALGLLQGCGGGSKGGGGDEEDDLRDSSMPVVQGEGGADAKAPDGTEPDAAVGMDSTTECVPKGCLEIEAELGISAEVSCGATPDGCGGTVDCGGCGNNNYLSCGGGGKANQCGCTPLTCADIGSAGQTSCGTAVPDGCGGTIPGGCGNCEGKVGDWQCNTSSSVCECSPMTKEAACGGAGRVCGTVSSGCGGIDYECGTCSAARNCGGDGTCTCKAPTDAYAQTACAGKTCGSVLVDGCPFTCGDACSSCGGGGVASGGSCATCECAAGLTCKTGALTCCGPATGAEITSLCAGKGCDETVTDPCTGAQISCACQGGQVCVGRTFFEAERAKKELGKSQCVSPAEANILGGYVVATHQYTSFILGTEKAETISLVTIVKKTDGSYQMIDQGCAARTAVAKSAAPAYFNVPPSIVSFNLAGNAWTRGVPQPTVPAGFVTAMPAFCPAAGGAPTAAPDYPTNPELEAAPTASSGSAKSWLGGGNCTCPTNACAPGNMTQACLPRQGFAEANKVTDCRVNDPDRDGRPGYTVIPELTNVPVTMASFGDTRWDGTLGVQGFHGGRARETLPFYRHFLSCGRDGQTVPWQCGLLNSAGSAPGCGADDRFNRIAFSKIEDYRVFEGLTCSVFFNRPLAEVAASNSYNSGAGRIDTAINAKAIQDYFNGTNRPLPTCSGPNACPEGSICRAGRCMHMTIPGACSTSADCNSNSANNFDGNAQTADWMCREDKSCGPSSC